MARKIIRVGETVRQQHLVPRSYLARFSDQRGQIVTYARHKRPRVGHYARECKERDFYEYDFGALRSDRKHDKWLESFEQAAGELYPLIEGQQPINRVQAINWSMFVASLFCRTRKYREQLVSRAWDQASKSMSTEQYVESVQARYLAAGHFKTKEEIKNTVTRLYETSPGKLVHAHLHEIDERCITLANLLLQRSWGVVRAAEGDEFPTSDAPVISAQIDEWGRVFLGHGFGKAGVCLLLPISPSVMFVATPHNLAFNERLSASDHQLFTRAIVQFAHKNVYARSEASSLEAIVDSEINEMVYGQTAFSSSAAFSRSGILDQG